MINASFHWPKSWLAIAMVILFSLVSCSERENVDPQMLLSEYLFGRVAAEDVKVFKDDAVMHGPTYFYFRSTKKDVDRLVIWLGLFRQRELPQIFLSSVEYLRENVVWEFRWSKMDVYAVYYCGGNVIDWSFDMLLVDDDGRVIYVTSGYVSDLSKPTKDFKNCAPRVD